MPRCAPATSRVARVRRALSVSHQCLRRIRGGVAGARFVQLPHPLLGSARPIERRCIGHDCHSICANPRPDLCEDRVFSTFLFGTRRALTKRMSSDVPRVSVRRSSLLSLGLLLGACGGIAEPNENQEATPGGAGGAPNGGAAVDGGNNSVGLGGGNNLVGLGGGGYGGSDFTANPWGGNGGFSGPFQGTYSIKEWGQACDTPGALLRAPGRYAACPGGCSPGCEVFLCACVNDVWACNCGHTDDQTALCNERFERAFQCRCSADGARCEPTPGAGGAGGGSGDL